MMTSPARSVGSRLFAGILGSTSLLAAALAAGLLLVVPALGTQTPRPQYTPPPDSPITYDTEITPIRRITDLALGAVQGVVVRDGKVYAYGDVVFAKPRIGVIREYDLDLRATGRSVALTREGKPLLVHPTGLTWNDEFGTWIGDTFEKRATIHAIDWARAWKDGNLDHAVLASIEDDAAVNGCRPEFIELDGKPLLATADYGAIRPEIRLLDPRVLLEKHRTSAPGAVVHRILAGPWNQNLHWDARTKTLICVQNVIEGRGWRLDELDLAAAVRDGRASGPGVRRSMLTFASHDELEGFWRLGPDEGLFAVARREHNLMHLRFQPARPRLSPPGTP
ncbi:MAG: hypothetical protein SFX72_07325 [Isosphaeraceae bacterium]|nr:hypothetical protein [Isosphaeraceae bacterium]